MARFRKMVTTDATDKSSQAVTRKISCCSGGCDCTNILCAFPVGQHAADGIQSIDTVHCLLGPVCAVPPRASGYHHRLGHLVGKICRPAEGTTCSDYGNVADNRFIHGHHCGVGCGSVLERKPGNGGLRFGLGRPRGWSRKSVRSVEEIPQGITVPWTPTKLCPVSVPYWASSSVAPRNVSDSS
jgi:hypothetical protein